MSEAPSDEELNVCIRAVAAQPAELLAALQIDCGMPAHARRLRTDSMTTVYVTFVDPASVAAGQSYATWVVAKSKGEVAYRVDYFITHVSERGAAETLPAPTGVPSTVPWIELQWQPTLTLLVLRCRDLERSRAFYAALGLDPRSERHGAGPRHFSIRCGLTVLELYPAREMPVPIRFGLMLDVAHTMLSAITRCGGRVVRIDGGTQAVLADPDQNLIELPIAR